MKTEQRSPQTFKKINASKQMKEIMELHFRELDEAAKTKSRKIAWCTSVGPAELLRAAGFLVFFPENHGAMLGSTRMATDLIPLANAIGYSPTSAPISPATSDRTSRARARSARPIQELPALHAPTFWYITRTSAATFRTGSTSTVGSSMSR